jgi:Leucine-rich repeat (LRR) protein
MYLRSVSLNNNQTSIIDDDAFYGLSCLQKLDLSHNKLTIIRKITFDSFWSLHKLLLSNNEIKTIEKDLFIRFEEFNGYNNRLQDFDDDNKKDYK